MQITRDIRDLIDRTLAEDLSIGDPTTDILVPPDLESTAVLLAKEEGILAGLDVGLEAFRRFDDRVSITALLEDGAPIRPGDHLGTIQGRVASLLKAERTAVNFMQHMSGIATQTQRYVKAVEGHPVRIVDTRKTTPGLRFLEKYAVRMGGGQNHRQNLGDGILIKDNHIDALRGDGMSLGDVVKKAIREASHTIRVEVEVETLEQLDEALDAGAGIILLDNMDVEQMTIAVQIAKGKAFTEASGGITLETVRAVAATGVDIISVGALTHSVLALDISMDMLD
ncbi:MAG TPA: carboxylating nicotinate-nucleotide diphosphorylase [Dehalococcoidia bacterium]|jgi:nicotinate-nucleotide pyrophosphorylase (carboxylating)|nr:carboxylating nicotinate-nucleotide diphosphorylase [SAR202 cluster bacterium]HAC20148.1 carboxylating nicotinate-nucleotide diphosphorylase [Dehalococcoidia bacterium]HHZ63090.1 carboxylating nicotinate-nucleotide diphosphorylase [Dehalococcoidia bacterium]HIM91573.1 carboxylating nicotinate-nucleotide diphosphorylase [Dehalococcoidia bacterium]HIO64531.1 carboxylating nicotinate-nucleotide diphosphorylase [Dehalococcoidia bacterium]|tara:strand:- start:1904 stop:2752 length:849 start_codon:yes stop_codon:yes gene_type:complete